MPLGLPQLSQAADIIWQTPQALSSALDVNNQGTLVTAKSTGYEYTVNGVFFDDNPANFSESFATGGGGFMGGITYIGNNDANGQAYAGLMNIAHGSANWGTATATISFSNLTVGQEYLVQYWVADYRGYPNDRYVTLTGGANTSGQLKYLDSDNSNGGIHGSYVIGTFTADATSQSILINANESTQMQAVQLRTGFAFTEANGIWTGGDGNWSDATKWDSNTIAQGVDKFAIFNGLAPVTATVDTGRPIGALLFSGANHTLSNGTGILTLDGNSTYPTPTVNVAAGITATVNATLAGKEGLLKSGNGTLVLGGTSSYSGSTAITAGTLSYAGASFVSASHGIDSGAVLEFNVTAGTYNATSTTINGGGTLRKIGTGNLIWPATVATFALDPGALIDVQGGTFTAGSYGNENWAANASDLNVASGAVFKTVEANVRVNKITGSGSIGTGYSGGGYQNLTIGVANGSSTFDGVITNTDNNPAFVGNLVKVGTGTIALTGTNTYTGTTTIEAGTLSLGNGTSNSNLPDLATVSIAAGAKVDLNFLSTNSDVVGKLIIDGNTLSGGTYDSTHPIYGSYFTGTGSLTVLDQNGTWSSLASGNWSSSSNWVSNTIAAGSGKTATFSAGTGSETITVTLDSARDIGNLAFSNATYNLAGGNTLTLGGSSTPTISVASGLTSTVTTRLAGTAGLVKSGPGTLTLVAGSGDNYGNVYNQNISGGLNISEGTVQFASEFIRMGSVTIGNGATLRTTHPWATGSSSNFGLNGASAGSFTVEAGGTLTSTTIANAFIQGITLTGGSVTAPGVTNGDWGAFIIASTVTAGGDTTSSISAELALAGNQTFNVLSDSTLDVSGVIHNRAGTTGAITKTGAGTLTLGGVNSYTGNTVVNDGALNVTGTLNFYPGVNGSTNSVSGSSTATLSYTGTVKLELGGAAATVGNSWNLVSVGSFTGPAPTLDPVAVSSSLGSFTEISEGTWELPVTGAKWVFTEADGKLSYVASATDYETWGASFGLASGSEAGDADNDGLTNKAEYAFGLIPNSGASVNPIVVPLDPSTGSFSYTRRDSSLTDLVYSVWFSEDLTTWTQDSGAVEGTPVLNGEVETVPVTLSTLPGDPLPAKLFIQVRAE